MFTRALVRPPTANLTEGLTRVDLGTPDFALALAQHRAYVDALAAAGLDVVSLAPDSTHPDATFIEDTAIVTARGAIVTRPGAASRSGEEMAVATALQAWFPRLGRIEAPGTVDGGDVCEAGEHYYIGISHRTNAEGARQLAAWLEQYGYTTSLVDIRGVDTILHLKSGIAWLDSGHLVAIDALADHPELRRHPRVRVDAAEEYAANCVHVNDRVLVASGHPRLVAALLELSHNVVELDMSEFAKLDGGLSCLSLRF